MDHDTKPQMMSRRPVKGILRKINGLLASEALTVKERITLIIEARKILDHLDPKPEPIQTAKRKPLGG